MVRAAQMAIVIAGWIFMLLKRNTKGTTLPYAAFPASSTIRAFAALVFAIVVLAAGRDDHSYIE
jgi:hypothetical protein